MLSSRALLFCFLSVLFPLTASASDLYLAMGSGDLLKVTSLQTGAYTKVGNSGRSFLDIARQESTGKMYGIAGSNLYSISTTDAASTLVGAMGISPTSATFCGDTLYVATTSLYTVNVATGAASLVGSLGGFESAGDLACSAAGDLYLSARGSSVDVLVKVNRTTGAGTKMGDMAYPTVYALDFDVDGVLYALTLSPVRMFTVNPATGATVANYDSLGLPVNPYGSAMARASNGQGCSLAQNIPWYQDNDGDTYGNSAVSVIACSAPAGYVNRGNDCDDTRASINPGAAELCDGVDQNCNGQVDEGAVPNWYQDSDGDGYGNAAVVVATCTAPSGYVASSTDCNDTNSGINPGAAELCDGIDQNCNTQIDEGAKRPWFRDADNDGFGTSTNQVQACTAPAGYVSNNTDCNDNNAQINPAIPEVCDGVDQNCNGQADEGTLLIFYADGDQDGYGSSSQTVSACTAPSGYVSQSGDCNPNNGTIYPGAQEYCNGVDDDCDGSVDEGVSSLWYADDDGDTYGDPTTTTSACSQPSGYVGRTGDCDDNNASVNSGAAESCNGIDDDCDGQVDDGVGGVFYADEDGDTYGDADSSVVGCVAPQGYVGDNTDCNDLDEDINPGAADFCNEVDDDCDGDVDEETDTPWYPDGDGDGYGSGTGVITACSQPQGYAGQAGDCNNANPDIYPGATEVCDGQDQDCDGTIDDGVTVASYTDSDGDGYGDPATASFGCSITPGAVGNGLDCDDTQVGISPVSAEIPYDGIDQNCDGGDLNDVDEDGFPSVLVSGGTDCDDGSAAVHPEVEEVLNGIDDNCDGHIDEGTPAADTDEDGYTIAEGDCADEDPTIYPGVAEICDGQDQDCNGITDEGTSCYDDDGDGFSEDGSVGGSQDCDDTNSNTWPGAPEYLDGQDNNCDGQIDNNMDAVDNDGDGSSEAQGDCNDSNGGIHPGATEICDDLDQDCDGIIDDGTLCHDDDGDGYTEEEGDCNDADDSIWPGAPEGIGGGAFGALQGNGTDDNCNGVIDEGTDLYDDDGDGVVEVDGDCLDDNAAVSPDEPEICDDVDQNCDGDVDDHTECSDDDGDLYSENDGDCDDTDPDLSPGEIEVLDGVDNDCDGDIDEGVEVSPTPDTPTPVPQTEDPSESPTVTPTPPPSSESPTLTPAPTSTEGETGTPGDVVAHGGGCACDSEGQGAGFPAELLLALALLWRRRPAQV